MKRKQEIRYSLAVNFFKESGVYIADCPTLQLSTCGKNIAEAKRMFSEALALWMETVVEMGTLDAALRELGWRVDRSAGYIMPTRVKYPLQKVNLLAQEYVPVTLPLAA